MNMKRILFGAVLTVFLCGMAMADTLYLRNGSVLQGNFLRYENDQIAFQLTSGGDRDRGRVLRFPIKEVLRIVTERDPDGVLSRANTTPTRTTASALEVMPTFDVRLANDWINSGIQVVQGQRIRVEASGQITMGRDTSSPAGLNKRDPNAPLPDDPDGALIASITNELSAPIILIGRNKEFVADRDGILYFTVNRWDISNTSGAYQVRVSLERRAGTGASTNPNRPFSNSPFACGLPDRFTETEGSYTAVWTRRGATNEYDAVWSRNGRQQVTAVLSISTQGNRIFVRRMTSSDGYLCEYEGIVAADGVSITGTGNCGGTTIQWQAKAECLR